MPYQLVIFDFDGTLADSFSLFTSVLEEAIARFGLRKPQSEEMEKLRGGDAREAMRALQLSFWKMPLVARFMRRRMAEQRERIRLFPGMAEQLQKLAAAGLTLSVVSSNSEETIRAVLGSETAKSIRMFLCGVSLFGKARQFQKALRDLHVPRQMVIAIGDEIRDAEAAKKSGINFGAVGWGYATPEALRSTNPRFVFERVDELAAALV